ncbi:uncharacterized protein BO66DRAFT_231449 [Aspergillus aculeatinus CBS 121060]|uniref:Uncharacterized protein n=1 Tax=Aspergillus aculeatinus CBS 121060 TaxID=1448322 RepID=A0ACD1GU26_9EURO|nr:hypothetical protein BO66DRAFT_231449 [Aspergillus aculeatinus CBS 121060]RAH64819.1 hypothetical protein BO66DRAFT_231449 [Aspergillus aculeatinus CBS 121060]
MELRPDQCWQNTRAVDLSGRPLCLVAISRYDLGLGDKAHNGRDEWILGIRRGQIFPAVALRYGGKGFAKRAHEIFKPAEFDLSYFL